jgi:signal transduction histidine kinase
MTHAHVLATDATHLGLVGGGVCVLLVLGLSFGFTLRLRRAVLSPLRELSEAARRIGRGELDIRVGDVGRGELLELSHAFDRMANELRAREARLVQSERMAAIGQLAAGVAHELNNPIGIIRGYLKTMTPDADPETLREELAILDEEAAQCQRIAEDLLAYARTSELTLTSLELRPFLEETVRRFRESPAGHRVTLDVDVQEARLEADAPRLRQVVLNLLTNAAQACPEGARTLLRGRPEGEMCVIEVDDEGPGIAVADRARVFEPFYSKRPGGTGLGLAVCAGIVEAHHGAIRVEDKDGPGALFQLRLPLTQAEASRFPKARP